MSIACLAAYGYSRHNFVQPCSTASKLAAELLTSAKIETKASSSLGKVQPTNLSPQVLSLKMRADQVVVQYIESNCIWLKMEDAAPA